MYYPSDGVTDLISHVFLSATPHSLVRPTRTHPFSLPPNTDRKKEIPTSEKKRQRRGSEDSSGQSHLYAHEPLPRRAFPVAFAVSFIEPGNEAAVVEPVTPENKSLGTQRGGKRRTRWLPPTAISVIRGQSKGRLPCPPSFISKTFLSTPRSLFHYVSVCTTLQAVSPDTALGAAALFLHSNWQRRGQSSHWYSREPGNYLFRSWDTMDGL